MRNIILIAHNLRSCHNVGSLLRTAEGLGISNVYLTGYTPYPASKDDDRLPHIANKINKQIQKTALGAETSVKWIHESDINNLISELKESKYKVVGLEQASNSIKINEWSPPDNLAIIIGRETLGIEPEIIELCDQIVEIPMHGTKESFNVVQAAAMALYHCRFS